MKNVPLLLTSFVKMWRGFQAYPGVYSLGDASKHLRYLVQPQRLNDWEMERWLTNQLRITPLEAGVYEIEVRRNGLVFYWAGSIGAGLAAGVLQEVNPRNPHFYTSPPVHLSPNSLVLDVGACEGLFAMRVARAKQAANIICFEPSARTAEYLLKAARRNGVSEKIAVENCAVGAASKDVYFTDSSSPEANRVVNEPGAESVCVRQTSLDDYCKLKGIVPKGSDLIKIDAEGADVDVVRGAERIIREASPQIAVTTYHDPDHARRLLEFLRAIQPNYKFRLKGVAIFGDRHTPRPVLLQASVMQKNGHS